MNSLQTPETIKYLLVEEKAQSSFPLTKNISFIIYGEFNNRRITNV